MGAEGHKNGFTTKKGSKLDLGATCGIEGPAVDRIVGGHEAMEHQWPWQVALFIDDAWFCGGAIMAGAHNVRESSEPNRVEITSLNGWTHPQWNTQDLSNDLALIELPSPLAMNDYISPSCMPSAGDTADVAELVT